MRTALITGASRGFGFEVARQLVADGWNVVVDGRDADALGAAAVRLRRAASAEATIIAIVGDVADATHRAELAASLTALGGVDLVVNNASILGPSPQPTLAEYPLDVFADVHRVNVVAPLALLQLTLPLLRESHGTVVNVTSDAGVEGYAGWGGYGSSKAALEQLSNVLAAEEPDVRVYWFDPGDMRTQMHQEAFPGEDISDRPPPETIAVPALLALLRDAPPSGRYRASELLVTTS